MATNRIYSTSGYSFWLTTTSAGYFLYDLYICTFRFEGAAYLMHGAFCFVLYTYTALSGFLHYYGAPACYCTAGAQVEVLLFFLRVCSVIGC